MGSRKEYPSQITKIFGATALQSKALFYLSDHLGPLATKIKARRTASIDNTTKRSLEIGDKNPCVELFSKFTFTILLVHFVTILSEANLNPPDTKHTC